MTDPKTRRARTSSSDCCLPDRGLARSTVACDVTGTVNVDGAGPGGLVPPLMKLTISRAQDDGFLRRHYLVFEPCN